MCVLGEWYKKKQDCSGKRNSRIDQDWSDSTASWVFIIHGDDWVLIPGTQFGPLSPTRSDLWYKELGVRTEHCHVWPQMSKQTGKTGLNWYVLVSLNFRHEKFLLMIIP